MLKSGIFSARRAVFAAAVVLGLAAGNGAMANTITVNLNGTNGSSTLNGPLDLSIAGGASPFGFFGTELTASTQLTGMKSAVTSSNLGFFDTTNQWNFDFSLGKSFSSNKPTSLNVTLSAFDYSGSLKGADFELIDLSKHDKVVATSSLVTPHGNELSLVASLPAGSKDVYDIVVKLSGASARFTATGSVPVPGALALFATALAGLGFVGMRSRRAGQSIA